MKAIHNFSQERTTAPVLTGETKDLRNAIRYVYLPEGIRILNEKPYAKIHQEGGTVYIYGRKPFVMVSRPFIGYSKVLMRNINEKIKRELIEILKD